MKGIKLITVTENIKEQDFPSYIEKKGWDCIKLIRKNYKQIEKIVVDIMDDYWSSVSISEIESKGKPDFFIWKGDRFYFCEFKSKNDSLRNDQMNWMANHIDYPVAIAFVNTSKRKIKKLEYSEEKIDTAVLNFINKNVKKLMKEYKEVNGFEYDESYFKDLVKMKLRQILRDGGMFLDVENSCYCGRFKKMHKLYFYYA